MTRRVAHEYVGVVSGADDVTGGRRDGLFLGITAASSLKHCPLFIVVAE